MANLYELSEAFKEMSNQDELDPTLLKRYIRFYQSRNERQSRQHCQLET